MGGYPNRAQEVKQALRQGDGSRRGRGDADDAWRRNMGGEAGHGGGAAGDERRRTSSLRCCGARDGRGNDLGQRGEAKPTGSERALVAGWRCGGGVAAGEGGGGGGRLRGGRARGQALEAQAWPRRRGDGGEEAARRRHGLRAAGVGRADGVAEAGRGSRRERWRREWLRRSSMRWVAMGTQGEEADAGERRGSRTGAARGSGAGLSLSMRACACEKEEEGSSEGGDQRERWGSG